MINETDIAIIQMLRQNSRESLAKMGKKIGIPMSTTYDKLKKLEENAILRHSTIVDFRQLGFSHRIHLSLKFENNTKHSFRLFACSNPNVNNILECVGEYDFIMDCLFRDLKEMHAFIEDIKSGFNPTNMKRLDIVGDIKQEGLKFWND
ncbi:Lrp/AsnC family transcriptional regulator [Candidatus Woesearchaeota archaeon]|nr:Lrp/AsnC family transcriptional regulator [Candidatus Woesearchaeota archaeon]